MTISSWGHDTNRLGFVSGVHTSNFFTSQEFKTYLGPTLFSSSFLDQSHKAISPMDFCSYITGLAAGKAVKTLSRLNDSATAGTNLFLLEIYSKLLLGASSCA